MAVKALCDNCRTAFSAQDEYLGKKLKCPNCGVKVEVLTPEARKAKDDWLREQQERIDLIETIDQRRRGTGGSSYAVEFGTGLDPVRNFNPGAVSRFRKLRALSNFLVLGAYLVLGLVLTGAGTCIYLYRDGAIGSLGLLALILLGCVLLLVFLFFLFKFLGELSWLLADLGDHQLDVRNLLLDLRDDLGRMLARRE